jgi:hypothetical protein
MANELARDGGRNWSRFSLAFAVGQKGRIGRLSEMLLNSEPRRKSSNAQIEGKRSHGLNCLPWQIR